MCCMDYTTTIQAVRLTSSGNQLRRLGQEIAARPFYYADTPDLELHSFLIFADATRYQVCKQQHV